MKLCSLYLEWLHTDNGNHSVVMSVVRIRLSTARQEGHRESSAKQGASWGTRLFPCFGVGGLVCFIDWSRKRRLSQTLRSALLALGRMCTAAVKGPDFKAAFKVKDYHASPELLQSTSAVRSYNSNNYADSTRKHRSRRMTSGNQNARSWVQTQQPRPCEW